MRAICLSLTCLFLMSCQQTGPFESTRSIGADPDSETGEVLMSNLQGIEAFAVEAVYSAHPTRALVDRVDTKALEGGHYLVHVEMSGGEAFRDIYDVTVSESQDGTLDIVEIKQVQGS